MLKKLIDRARRTTLFPFTLMLAWVELCNARGDFDGLYRTTASFSAHKDADRLLRELCREYVRYCTKARAWVPPMESIHLALRRDPYLQKYLQYVLMGCAKRQLVILQDTLDKEKQGREDMEILAEEAAKLADALERGDYKVVPGVFGNA